MGWWRAGEDGSSLHTEETGLVWGDTPADILDEALQRIAFEFQKNWDRLPTVAEYEAGLKFALASYDPLDAGYKNTGPLHHKTTPPGGY